MGPSERRRRPVLGRFGLLTAVGSSLLTGHAAMAGETRCWIDNGALVAPAAFGDIAGDFLIDLAAPASELHNTRAESDGIAADGPEAASVTRDLSIAGEPVKGFSMTVADLDARTRAFDTTINGVIGADLLDQFTVEIRFSPCRLRLTRRASTADRPPVHGVRLPVRIVDGRPLAAATLSDGVRVRPGWFAIGTADWASLVSGARLSRPLPTATPTAPAAEPPPVRLRAMEIGGRLFEQVPATVAPEGDDDTEGVIGMAVWSRWSLRLDARAGWLDLTPAD